ncbi:Unannotated [Lentimonas sp. CC19]|nr:Unannotated [Lentimonas sp. CC19]CAA6693505.1 Unannotated [Lentimonas sp. CC10]CAA7070812.1 Unannotated [Lentimonas sp. CC11]
MKFGYSPLSLFCVLLFPVLQCMGASHFTFDSSAEPASLVLGGVDRLNQTSSDGFYLRHFDGKDVTATQLTHVTFDGDTLTVSESGGLPQFTLRIDTYDQHVSIHLIEVEGIGDSLAYGLVLELDTNANIGLRRLSDIVEVSSSSIVRYTSAASIQWRYLWGEALDGNLGGVAIFNGTLTGSNLDAALAEVWVTEDLVRPAGQSSWTEDDVLNWVADYAAQHNSMNEVMLEATSLEDLYELTDSLAIAHGVKRVYLHTKTWRGEYWPKYNSRVHVNTDVFPAGKADLLIYANYLKSNGIHLRLHSVSCGIGEYDPDYIVGGVDPRLASWGSGTLEQDIDSSERRILFRPAEDSEIPLLGQGIAHVGRQLDYEYLKIGEEIVKVGEFIQTEDDVWILENCIRGQDGTDSADHSASVEMIGLYCSYGRNYIPAYDLDEPDSLMDELALEYATFVNELQLGHLHFDGPEIHRIHPWVERDLLDRIYSYVDHPTTSSRVGRSISAHFEQAFSAVRDDRSYDYFSLEIGIRLDEPDNLPATSLLDTSFHVQEGVMLGGRRPQFTVPQSGYAISQEEVEDHGLFNDTLELFLAWIEIAPVLHEDDVDYIDTFMERTTGSNHYQSEYVLLLSRNTNGDYVFTPTLVLGQTSGVDDPWYIHQEKGSVTRKQAIVAGDTLLLDNPEAAQSLQFVIRVDQDATQVLTNPSIEIDGGTGSLAVTGTVNAGEYLQYEGGSTALRYDVNWKLLETLPVVVTNFTVVSGTNSVQVLDGASAAVDLETQFIVEGTDYVLEANNAL